METGGRLNESIKPASGELARLEVLMVRGLDLDQRPLVIGWQATRRFSRHVRTVNYKPRAILVPQRWVTPGCARFY